MDATIRPALRTEPFDNLKYIPLSPTDPQSYMSLGMNLRERFESLNAPFRDPPKADLSGKSVLILSNANDPIAPPENAASRSAAMAASTEQLT